MLEVGIRSVRLGSRVIVAPVAFQVPPGAILTLMGPSGSGKSTVLHAILGTLAPPLLGATASRSTQQRCSGGPTTARTDVTLASKSRSLPRRRASYAATGTGA